MQKIHDFIHGFSSFQERYFCGEESPFSDLLKGQKPSTLVIACCDSRTDPSLIMQCEPGDIFVVRNIANIVPPYEPDERHHGVSAALEYAVLSLEVSDIIVLGHSCCGGISTLLRGNPEEQGDFIGPWISVLRKAREQVLTRYAPDDEQAATALEMAGVLASLDNLMTFPWIAKRVEREELTIHGWYFNMERGRLFSYLEQTGSFEPLTPYCPAREETTQEGRGAGGESPQT